MLPLPPALPADFRRPDAVNPDDDPGNFIMDDEDFDKEEPMTSTGLEEEPPRLPCGTRLLDVDAIASCTACA